MPSDPDTKPGWLCELPTCPSTNTWALDHLEALAHGACIWCQRQTAGRGQNGKAWFSPPGVLTASVVLDLPASVPAHQLSLSAGLAVAHAIEDLVPKARVQLKWPNDCLIEGRKLAGVLCERRPSAPLRSGPVRDQVVVGIGLNLDPRWDQQPQALPMLANLASPPASIAELQTPPSMVAMLIELRRYLIEATAVLAVGGWKQLIPQLKRRDWLKGRAVQISVGAQRHVGIAGGLDDEGCLILCEEEGPNRHLASGSVMDSHPA